MSRLWNQSAVGTLYFSTEILCAWSLDYQYAAIEGHDLENKFTISHFGNCPSTRSANTERDCTGGGRKVNDPLRRRRRSISRPGMATVALS